MKKLAVFVAISISAALGVTGCASGRADAERYLAAMDQQNSRDHEKVMLAFISKAQSDDVDGMIALTSKTTIKLIGGEEKERALYRGDTIPVLKLFRNISTTGETSFGADNQGHYGWKFKRTFLSADGKQAQLQFTILREDLALVVAYFGVWERG